MPTDEEIKKLRKQAEKARLAAGIVPRNAGQWNLFAFDQNENLEIERTEQPNHSLQDAPSRWAYWFDKPLWPFDSCILLLYYGSDLPENADIDDIKIDMLNARCELGKIADLLWTDIKHNMFPFTPEKTEKYCKVINGSVSINIIPTDLISWAITKSSIKVPQAMLDWYDTKQEAERTSQSQASLPLSCIFALYETSETMPSSNIQGGTNTAASTILTPDWMVKQLQNEGIPAKEIARRLDEVFTSPKISNAELGRLLPANPGTVVSHETARSQGKRLRGKK
ncbi:hypothetical protein JMF94_13345 [Desulfovibrio sp. UIB00]|uniref:hypothetical protein n=1 Tax=Desulfovibrio sp. UIB00 TaxID=2804314 RepID=UPI001F0F1D6B|nr:hypothetical protein [Desulfovibrio sp. UIB00]MCH5146065.1 hypothetical protein [Desulfovibrio sp. UIB00]